MKIDAYRSEIPSEAVGHVAKPAISPVNRETKNPAATPVTGDALQLSSDAQLMQTVMQSAAQQVMHSAQQISSVRQDVVERMRAAVANGTVGNDPHALADALLDRLISTTWPPSPRKP